MTDWVELLVSYDEIEVQIVKSILDAEGIQNVLNSLKVSPYPVSVGKIGEVKLLVRNEDLEKAKTIIKIMRDTSNEN